MVQYADELDCQVEIFTLFYFVTGVTVLTVSEVYDTLGVGCWDG